MTPFVKRPPSVEEVQHEFDLFSKQVDFVACEAPYIAFVGGIGSGKTRAGVVKCLQFLVENPGALGMVTAPTYPMLKDATLRTVFDIFPPELYTFHHTDMRLTMTNGSELLFRSTDEPERLRGPNLAFAYMDEAARSKGDAWKILQGRLRQEGMPHQAWITTTPQGYNWVYMEFALHERADYELIPCSSRENRYLPSNFVQRLEESNADDFALQEIEGQFVVVGGKAFFSTATLKRMLTDSVEPVETRLGGAVKIWRPPVVAGRYVAGADLAWGETGAFDCLTVLDWQTGEQVAEIHGRLPVDEMARETVNLCQEYNDAYLGAEVNGEGRNVINKMIDLGYGGRMYHRSDDFTQEERKRGWLTDVVTRPVMLGELEEAVRNRQLRPRCRDAVSEMLSFVRDERGRPSHAEGSYDDHVMSWALAWQMRGSARFSSGGHGPVHLGGRW